jgi:hypothetical protein
MYKVGNLTKQNISSFGEYVPQTYHFNVTPIQVM